MRGELEEARRKLGEAAAQLGDARAQAEALTGRLGAAQVGQHSWGGPGVKGRARGEGEDQG